MTASQEAHVGSRRPRWIVWLLVGCALSAGAQEMPAGARNGQGDLLSRLSLASNGGPVSINANQLEFDYRTRTLTYRGTVVVSQGDLKVSSDALRVVLDEQAREVIREVIAEGKVRIEQGQRVATGGRAVFDQAKRTVVLSEDAVLREGLNEVAGERVVVYLDEERSVVEGGGGRVRALLYPDEIEKRSKEGTPDDHEH
jgi:lipopolysaccharide export system protein LptA